MSEFENLLKPIKRILTVVGLNVIDVNWETNFWGLNSMMLIVLLTLGSLVFFAENLGDIDNVENVAESGGVLGSVSALLTKVVVLLLKRNEIISFYNDIKGQYITSHNKNPAITDRYAKQFSLITKIFAGLLYILPILYTLSSLIGNETARLPLLMKVPFLPINGWPFFHINYLLQLLIMWTGVNLAVVVELLTFFYIHYICCRIEILAFMVDCWNNNIKFGRDYSNGGQDNVSLTQIVDYHSSIKRTMDVIRRIFSPMIMSVLLTNSLVICMCLVMIFLNPSLKMLTHFVVALSQTFMYCYVGNILLKQNDDLVERIMMVDFYDLKVLDRKAYLNVVQSACKPIKLQSYFVTVDMTLFFKVVKFGYSVFSLMKTRL